jgi:predicted AAA+ superfamily ATPase
MDNLFIDRNLSDAIRDAFRYFQVITITGARQSGKTTLIRHLFPDFRYYSLENPNEQYLANTDTLGFLNATENGVIIDEAQHAPALFSYIQGIVDNNPKRKFIISGSSNFSLLKNITQSLAGRTAVFELMPVSYSEIKHFAAQKTLDKLLFDGFYPAVYAGKNSPELLYSNYVKTYLERDVRDLLRVNNMLQFQTFLRLCAGRIGSIFNASELSNEVGVSVTTVKSWLSMLQTSYTVFLLPPYFENLNKRLTKRPKLYFTDTGIACYLLDIENDVQLSKDKMRGHLFENFVVMEYLKSRLNKGRESNLYFYRDSNRNEVDLLLRKGDCFTAIEIKSSQTYHPDFEKGIKAFEKIFGNRVTDKKVIYAGDLENPNGDIQLHNYKNVEY